MTLAAIRVRNGEIIDRAGHASGVTVTPVEGGFKLHGAMGPPPEGWAQSPDDAVVGWEQAEGGITIWAADDDITIRFVPDESLLPEPEEGARKPFPAPDWGRVMSIKDAQAKRTARGRTGPEALAGLLDKVADLESRIQTLERGAK